jgi:hypothetical protein
VADLLQCADQPAPLCFVPGPSGSSRNLVDDLERLDDFIPITKAKFGHTFTTHGQNSTNFLTQRAKGSGQAQGQFLDDQAAAKFIRDNIDKVQNGAVSLPVPEGLSVRIINPDGSYSPAATIRLVPGGNGVKTAYPEP